MSKLIQAELELDLAGWYAPDTVYGEYLPKAVVELVRVFSEQGHSGMSAGLVLNLFTKLAKFEVLSPLTGEDSEWKMIPAEMAESPHKTTYQNTRAPAVFKTVEHENGAQEIYQVGAYVFTDLHEGKDCTYTSHHSTKNNITFPYTPTVEYVGMTDDAWLAAQKLRADV